MGIVCELFRNVGEGEFFTSHDEPPQRCIKIKPPGIKHGGVNCYCIDTKEWLIAEPNEAVVPDGMKIRERRIIK